MENQAKEGFGDHDDHHKACGRHFGAPHLAAKIVGGIVVAILFALAFGWLVMVLWNWLMPTLFKLTTITYWQGFGILLFAKMLFGGLHHAGHPSRPSSKRRQNCWSWCDKDEWAPAGDHRNWKFYRQYWKERGKKDFEAYLQSTVQETDKKSD